MNNNILRNNIIRKYIEGHIHYNWIKHDPNADFKHREKVNQICNFLIENNVNFLCRPIFKFWAMSTTPMKKLKIPLPKKFIPDILCFIEDPFKPVIIEVIN